MPETPRSYPYPEPLGSELAKVARAIPAANAILDAIKPLVRPIADAVAMTDGCHASDDEIVSVHVRIGDCRALVRAIEAARP